MTDNTIFTENGITTINSKATPEWFVEYEGPRGGKWITNPLTEEAARKKFAEIGDAQYALLLKKMPLSTFNFREVIEKSAVADLRMYEALVKDHKKRLTKTEKAIESCKVKMVDLKKRIKNAGGK